MKLRLFVTLLSLCVCASFVVAAPDKKDMAAKKEAKAAAVAEKKETKAAAVAQKKEAKKIVYCCPRHMELKSDKPGKCPQCGLNLEQEDKIVPIKILPAAQDQKVEKKAYVCPMHPEITSDKKGKCSICGMKLVKNE